MQRLRFEHPEVQAVVVTGGLDKVFCAGANIQMLAGSTHAHKVNFCKFTNETRNCIEDATAHSGQVWIAAVNGTAAGGGLRAGPRLRRDRPGRRPGVGGLAPRGAAAGGVARHRWPDPVGRQAPRPPRSADVFATRTEGVKGQQAVEWGLVDAIAPRSRFDEVVRERAATAGRHVGPSGRRTQGVELTPLAAHEDTDRASYDHVDVRIDRELGAAYITVRGPRRCRPATRRGTASRRARRVVAGRVP